MTRGCVGLRDGSTANGPGGRDVSPERFGKLAPRAWRQQLDDRVPDRRPRACRRAILFSAVGTAGQRCTTLRRLIVHESVADQLVAGLQEDFSPQVKIGDPREPDTLIGPLIDEAHLTQCRTCLATGSSASKPSQGDFYVRPSIVEMQAQFGNVLKETFAPILYVLRYDDLGQGDRAQQLVFHKGFRRRSSRTTYGRLRSSCPPRGSDCGIANVNIGPSGAEIGGAFGGEKETGGGRESGSDSWRAYMRRQTNTVNYGADLPLAQGIRFDIAP